MNTDWKYITQPTGFKNCVDVVCKVPYSTSRKSSRVREALDRCDRTLRDFASLERRCINAVYAEGTDGDAEEEGRDWAEREARDAREYELVQRKNGEWAFEPL